MIDRVGASGAVPARLALSFSFLLRTSVLAYHNLAPSRLSTGRFGLSPLLHPDHSGRHALSPSVGLLGEKNTPLQLSTRRGNPQSLFLEKSSFLKFLECLL